MWSEAASGDNGDLILVSQTPQADPAAPPPGTNPLELPGVLAASLARVITGGAAPDDHPPGKLLRLRPPRLDDEAAFRAAHQVMAAEEFTFGLDLEPTTQWGTYLEALQDQRCGLNLAEGRVPATFLLADVAGLIVGRTSIRHQLNDRLEQAGGWTV